MLFLSIAACALMIGAQLRGFMHRLTTRRMGAAPSAELGLESAWPHVRMDCSLSPATMIYNKRASHEDALKGVR